MVTIFTLRAWRKV